jgi:hypothetical protein
MEYILTACFVWATFDKAVQKTADLSDNANKQTGIEVPGTELREMLWCKKMTCKEAKL